MDAAEKATEQAYTDLETLCICFPARITGSEILEKSLDYLYEYGQMHIPAEHCHEEVVPDVPHWVRGDWREDSLFITIEPSQSAWPEPFPLTREVQVMANGMSVGTGPDGISGQLVLVKDWEQLQALGEAGQLTDKIVLYDYMHFSSYSDLAGYRFYGANRAAAFGAKAALIRSLTPDASTSGAHTGTSEPFHPSMQGQAIPGACIAVEDAEMLRRLAERGHSLSVTLKLACQTLPPVNSRNLVFEIPGTDSKEVVLIGAHADCWDCLRRGCQGAHDDGQGVIICLTILRILYANNWRPKRTIRVVVFTDEEVQSTGGKAYARTAKAEDILVAIETDLGIGPVAGFGCTANPETKHFLRRELLPVLRMVMDNAHLQIADEWTGRGVDIGPLLDLQVPGLLLRHEDAWWEMDYFHLHHTNSDTIDKVDKKLLKSNLLMLLSTVWVLANTDEPLPRG